MVAIRAVNGQFLSHDDENVIGDMNKVFLNCLKFFLINAYLSDFSMILRQGWGDRH